MAEYFMRFPGGVSKALTLSYDDGVEQDIRLIEIMQKHGIKGTFNLNSGSYSPEGTVFLEGQIHRRLSKSQAQAVYKNSGMEVAVHGLTHPFLEQLPANICTYEVLQDRINLEADFGCIVRGMAYPFGTYNDAVVASLQQCGILYSRTVESTEQFEVPTDWLRMPATCHHRNPKLMALAQTFVESEPIRSPQLFYLWGHSYEFEKDDNWKIIEDFCAYMGNRNEIWYATNMEIYEYVQAYHQLVFSMDSSVVYNPSAIDVYFSWNRVVHCVKAGKQLRIQEG